ncbi:MAG: substrate-binding domain-containing protein [Solobacterium sp.]|nr:substrate-binding domain-containing protein [Solobacterium sp.]
MKKAKTVILLLLCAAVMGTAVWFAVRNNYQEKHSGHGFKYMNGFSSTDFTGYHVYDGGKLASLDHDASLIIEQEEDMPVLDGAEACYPLYCAAARAVYKNIAEIETEWKKEPENKITNGKIVTFTNTVYAYQRLVEGDADIVFAARPSQEQKEYAHDRLVRICTVPVAKEAFVFFVEEDNPVDSLSAEQIRDIYSGKITNWKEVGGEDRKILAYQRPENSGSQVMMKYFMKDVPLQEPETFERIGGMGDVIREVAQYANENGAMGYTFRYFLLGLQQEQHVKILKIDGVEPTIETIENGTYPAVASVVMAYLEGNDNPNVQKMIEFMQSEDGQELIEKTGYAPLGEKQEAQIENDIADTDEYVNGNGTLTTAGDWSVLVWKGKTYRNYFSYYGQDMDSDFLRDRYSVLLEKNGVYAEMILRMDANRLIVEGYLENDSILEKAPFDDLPETGTEFVLK